MAESGAMVEVTSMIDAYPTEAFATALSLVEVLIDKIWCFCR